MREPTIYNNNFASLNDNSVSFETTPETEICFSCDPKKKCNGDCKRFREEMRKLKRKEKEKKKNGQKEV